MNLKYASLTFLFSNICKSQVTCINNLPYVKKEKNHHSIIVLDVLVHSKSLLNSCRAIFIPSNKTELILCPSYLQHGYTFSLLEFFLPKSAKAVFYAGKGKFQEINSLLLCVLYYSILNKRQRITQKSSLERNQVVQHFRQVEISLTYLSNDLSFLLL